MSGFWGHVTGHEPPRGAGEAPVGEKGDRFAQPLADEGGGHAEHLSHSGSTLGAFVADYHDVPLIYLSVSGGLHRLLLGFEDARWALVVVAGVARDLDYAALGGEVAFEDHEPPRLSQGALC